MTEISRREFLRVSALAAAGAAAVACAKTAEPEGQEPPAPKSEEQATPVPEAEPAAPESPMLSELVQAGSLPPLEERLPTDAMTISAGTLMPTDMVDWAPGKFGGTMRFCTARTDVCAELYDANAEQPLMTPGKLIAGSPDVIQPCLFSAFEVSDDQKSITWHMRKGMK